MARQRSKRVPDLGLDPGAIAAKDYRTRQLNIRVSPSDLKSIRAVAKRLGVSVADYLLALHHQAVEALSRRKEA